MGVYTYGDKRSSAGSVKISSVITDTRQSLRQVVVALQNGLRAGDNFAGDGKTGQALISNGPNLPPSWQDISAGGGPVDVSRLVGIINSGNIVGAYPGITGVGNLTSLTVVGGATIGGGIIVNAPSTFSGQTFFTDGVHTVTLVDGTQACVTTGPGGTTHLSDATYGVHTTGPGQFDTTLGVTGVATFATDVSVAGKLQITGAAGTNRELHYQTTGLDRWVLRTGNTAESGSNAGSNFFIFAFDDTGAAIDSPLSIVRAAGGAISIPAARSLSHSTGVIIGLLATAKIGLDGTDGAFVSGENSLFESGGNIFASVRGGFLIAASNISVAGRVVFRVNVGNTGATNILSLTDGGAFAVVGTGSFSSQLVVGTTTPINVLDVRTGVSGAWGQYATITSSATTAYQGGLLHTNVTSGIAGNNSFKMVATFTSTTASKRFRMGWVDNSATETWLDSANAAVEFGPLGTIGLMTAGNAAAMVKVTGTVTGFVGVTQRCLDLDFQNNSTGTTENAVISVRGGTAAAAFTVATVYGIHIFSPVVGAGSTITNLIGLRIDSQSTGGTSNFAIQTSTGRVSFGDRVDITPPVTGTIGLTINPVAVSTVAAMSILQNNSIATAINITQTSGIGGQVLFVSGGTQTGASGVAILDMAQTWNTTGAPTAIKLNITNTASGAAAKLMDLQIGGTSMFNVTPGTNASVVNVTATTSVQNTVTINQVAGIQGVALIVTGGTVNTAFAAPSGIVISQTWNNAAAAPVLFQMSLTNTSSTVGALLFNILVGGTALWTMAPNAFITHTAATTGAYAITQVNATTGAGLQMAGGTVTGTVSGSLLNFAQTWNAAANVVTGILVNITNTASNGSSKYIDLQTGGTSTFSVTALGTITSSPANASGSVGHVINQTQAGQAIQIAQQAGMTGQAIQVFAGSVTGASSTNMIDLTTIWNTTGTPKGISVSITNTASAAGARLIDLQVGGASKFAVDVAGNAYVAATQVLSTRATGWTAWTGTATRTTKATSTATLQNVAEAVKALIDDLIHHGLIGA